MEKAEQQLWRERKLERLKQQVKYNVITIVLGVYHRLGFDCKILMIANCEFFWSLQSKESQSDLACIVLYSMGSSIAIIRFTIWPDKPKMQSLNHAIKTCPTVLY